VPTGLQSRLVLALVATSAVTLVAAILTLVPPLEHRLERNRLGELRQLARTARFGLRNLPASDLRQGSPRVRVLVRDLRARTGGRVALYAPDGESLADTDPDLPRAEPDVAATSPRHAARLSDAGLQRHGDVREGVLGGQAVVVTAVHRPDGRRLTLVLRKPLGDTRAAVRSVRRAVLPAAAVGVGVSLLMALALGQGLLVRLRRLRDDARALGDEGLGHPVRVGPQDEVGEVAGSLEAMRTRLVDEEAARQAFLATASHELRTPLATLQGTLELLREDLGSANGRAGARADTALHQTHRLVGLATDLLDLNRLDGDAPLVAEPVELSELAQVAAGEVAEALAVAGRELQVTSRAPQHALADPTATLRVLRILLDNAVAYAAPGGVRVDVGREGAEAVVRVADDGPGLAADELERVFRRFERGRAGSARAGFGLGLPLARGLAERMGGRLAAVRAARGACFELRLPAWAGPPGER
jgi:signal transduction histidine kinase